MSNTKELININSVVKIQELDDVLASQCRGGLSLSVTAKAGESAAAAATSDGTKATAGNGEVSVSFDDDATSPSFTFPDIFGDFSFFF